MAKRSAHAAPPDLSADIGEEPGERKPLVERLLDVVEHVGNRVPHPVVIFVMLIGILMLLSHVFYLFGAAVTFHSVSKGSDQLYSPGRRSTLP